MRLSYRLIGLLTLCAIPGMAAAASQSFSDVPPNHPTFAAAEYLKEQEIIQGYNDGTFHPDQAVNRAEAMKIIVLQRAPVLAETGGIITFKDVPADAWFALYVEQAYKQLKIIDGPPKTPLFYPDRTVTRAEFLKMLFLAYGTDPQNSFGELTFPLADDVQGIQEWYYPFIRFALTADMLTVKNNNLEPGTNLTRADMANMLYRFLLYRSGKRTQTLLSVTENETLTTLRMIENNAPDTAEQAAARAILAARGALALQPDDSTVKGSVKIAESAMALVTTARLSMNGETAKTIDSASTVWHLAEKAKSFSSSLNALAGQLQNAATESADRARSAK